MADILRIENKVPFVYCNESRDFLLLCRLYTAVINSVKNDIDSIPYINDTQMCKTDVLPLLSTKLGFFTSKNYDDTKLRYILNVFPLLVKNKGSLGAINYAMNIFLKIYDIRTEVTVHYVLSSPNPYGVSDHTLVIGIHNYLGLDTSLLEDLMRYILPTGYYFYIYYYTELPQYTLLTYNSDKLVLLFASDQTASNVRTYIDVEDWDNKAIISSNSSLSFTTSDTFWQTFRLNIGTPYQYFSYEFVYNSSQRNWIYSSEGTIFDFATCGLTISGTPQNGDILNVVSSADMLIGAVDTTELKSSDSNEDNLTTEVVD